jgi:hypothetical protein
MSILKCAMQPSVTDIQVDWTLPAGGTAITIPKEAPPILFGEKMILYALITGVAEENQVGPELQNNYKFHDVTFTAEWMITSWTSSRIAFSGNTIRVKLRK